LPFYRPSIHDSAGVSYTPRISAPSDQSPTNNKDATTELVLIGT